MITRPGPGAQNSTPQQRLPHREIGGHCHWACVEYLEGKRGGTPSMSWQNAGNDEVEVDFWKLEAHLISGEAPCVPPLYSLAAGLRLCSAGTRASRNSGPIIPRRFNWPAHRLGRRTVLPDEGRVVACQPSNFSLPPCCGGQKPGVA